MRYLGGKSKLAKKIAAVIKPMFSNDYVRYWEPFIGAGYISEQVTAKFGWFTDSNEYLIAMWSALWIDAWQPPDVVTEVEYNDIKNNKDKYPPELVSFVGFGCSFGGKWFGGYARGNDAKGVPVNFALNGKKALLRKIANIGNNYYDIWFEKVNFNDQLLNVKNAVIYCDPPYAGTTKYRDKFDSEKFWERCREYSVNNIVVISEFNAPNDFEEIARFDNTTGLRNTNQNGIKTIDKLFKYKG